MTLNTCWLFWLINDRLHDYIENILIHYSDYKYLWSKNSNFFDTDLDYLRLHNDKVIWVLTTVLLRVSYGLLGQSTWSRLRPTNPVFTQKFLEELRQFNESYKGKKITQFSCKNCPKKQFVKTYARNSYIPSCPEEN